MSLPARSMNNANETNSSRPSAKPNTHLYASLVKDVRDSYYGTEAICILIMGLIDLGLPFFESCTSEFLLNLITTIAYNKHWEHVHVLYIGVSFVSYYNEKND